MLETTLHGGPSCPLSTPVPTEQEQPPKELGEVAVAGPSA